VRREQAQDASAEAAAAMTDVIAALRSQGIADEDMQTLTLSLEARFNYRRSPQRLLGYEASNVAAITIRDLERIGTILAAAVEAGANLVGGISFGVEDSDALTVQARDEAMSDARAKADALAASGGVEITGVQSIVEFGPPPAYYGDSGASADEGTPVLGGQVQVAVTVTVVYAIG
jgi:uncharacterized protein YggE